MTKPLLTLMHCAASFAASSHSFIPAYDALCFGTAERDREVSVTQNCHEAFAAKDDKKLLRCLVLVLTSS